MVKAAVIATKFSIRFAAYLGGCICHTFHLSPAVLPTEKLPGFPNKVYFILIQIWGCINKTISYKRCLQPTSSHFSICQGSSAVLYSAHPLLSLAEESTAGALQHILLDREMSNSPRGFEQGCVREQEEGVQKPTAYTERELKSLTANFSPKY